MNMTHILAKQLDELMGVNRNGDRSNLIVKDFLDKRVCKYDLCGLCPYQLFPNTKHDLGKCPYEVCPVPDEFKKKYQEERKRQDFGYEYELEQLLERVQRECDERITRHQRRLETQQKIQITNEPPELKNIRQEIEDVTKRIEDLTNEGQIDTANELMEKLEILKREKSIIEAKMPSAKDQQLIVCEICAALLSANESDQRLADHFAGKMHLGFQKVRDKLKELRENRSFEDRRQRDIDRARGYRRGHPDIDFERDYEYRKRRSGEEQNNYGKDSVRDSRASSSGSSGGSRDYGRHHHGYGHHRGHSGGRYYDNRSDYNRSGGRRHERQ